ncbi:hypothetical protein [Limnoraphis robusta]|uniref:hypothetical protein n=1 Tax=Limnoraphis robusta TaxID=1118279 RepID=UPI002B211F89|nr:hypothetical protein [Limnoraphis robusta]MEA5497547.1 hypothetical protein [Limnoraphis robusta BA-68 BA1]
MLFKVFQNGQPVWNETTGDVFKLVIYDSSSATLSQVANIPTLANYLLEGESNLTEYCIKFQTPQGITLVFPVLECIRAFLVPNKTLAFGLLEPNYFERVITRNEIIGNKLLLDFSEDMAKRVLSKPFTFSVARLLHDSSFRSAWDRVYRDRLSQASQVNWNSSIPLVTNLPRFTSNWHVRGLLTEQILWVQQILEVAPVRSLPFSELEFTHPRIKKRESVEKKVVKRQRKQKKAVHNENVIETEASPPKLATPTRNLPRLRSSIIERKKLKITQTGATSVTVPKTTADLSKVDNQDSEAVLKSQTVNLADTGVGGQNQPAEFALRSPMDIFVATDDGLNEFAEAIRFLDETHWNISVTWEVREFAKETLFAKIADRTRKFALVKLESSEQISCWILEFGRPDNFSISTLLFSLSPQNVQAQYENLLDQLLTQALLPQGGWQRSILKKLQEEISGFVFALTKHTSKSTEDWGERLYKKAKEIINL